MARIPTDPCTQAGGAALPVRVTRTPCLPYHSGRRKETSEDGAHMPLLLSSMALPFRREQPELIDDPRQKLFRSDGCSSDRIAPSWCQVAGLPARYRARRISRGPTRESGTAPTVQIRHMPPRDLNRATCRCNAARRKASLFLLEWTPTRPSTQRPLRKARTETAVRKTERHRNKRARMATGSIAKLERGATIARPRLELLLSSVLCECG